VADIRAIFDLSLPITTAGWEPLTVWPTQSGTPVMPARDESRLRRLEPTVQLTVWTIYRFWHTLKIERVTTRNHCRKVFRFHAQQTDNDTGFWEKGK